jgi:uncharacterized glyoxalase superfamily protein PhnB
VNTARERLHLPRQPAPRRSTALQMRDGTIGEFGSAVIPVVRYRNLPAAIDWLCSAFGFEKHRIALDNNGGCLFAQLAFGNALVMVSPVRTSAFDKLMRQPDEVGGAETQVCYFFVRDANAHCARARAAGAEIVFDVENRVGGGRSYSCRDLEGHLWNFGTYNPWGKPSIARVPANAHPDPAGMLGKRARLAAGLLAGLALIAIPASRVLDPDDRAVPVASIETGSIRPEENLGPLIARLARSEAANAEAEKATLAAQDRLAAALVETGALRSIATVAHAKAAQAGREKAALEQRVNELQERLFRALVEKNASDHAAREARRRLATERAARQSQAQSRMLGW